MVVCVRPRGRTHTGRRRRASIARHHPQVVRPEDRLTVEYDVAHGRGRFVRRVSRAALRPGVLVGVGRDHRSHGRAGARRVGGSDDHDMCRRRQRARQARFVLTRVDCEDQTASLLVGEGRALDDRVFIDSAEVHVDRVLTGLQTFVAGRADVLAYVGLVRCVTTGERCRSAHRSKCSCEQRNKCDAAKELLSRFHEKPFLCSSAFLKEAELPS